jgi:hypothetical protein
VNLGTIGLAATAANQSTANGLFTSIDGKLPQLGQAIAANSIPVVLTAAQLSTLTPLANTPVNPVPSAYSTSGTPSTWTQALAANSSRRILFVQNPPTNTANIDIGFGGSGSEGLAAVLQPGDYVDAKNVPISSRISCRSTSASVSVIVWEA